MVKADPKRDYYADLEVKPTADTEEIKRQFRKLALKYHPDRNPGREAECVPRFQAIQAAHEILSDPDQRGKYDSDRRKHGLYTSFARPNPPPRTNPYAANSPFPPPPRRTQAPPPRTRPEYTSTASNGASRFSNFPPPPTSARTPGGDPANVFSAWQHMHRKKAQASQEEPFKSKNPWADAAKPNLGRSNTTKVPKKTGFDPAMPGADEPQARGTSAYYTTSRYDQRPVPPTPEKPSMSNSTKSTFDDVPFSEGRPRMRAPYASNSGERTFTTSASARHSPIRPDTGEHQPFQSGSTRSARPRSASPGPRKPFNGFTPRGSPTAAAAGTASASTAKTRTTRTGGNATRPFSAYNLYPSSDEEFDGGMQIPRRSKPPAPRTNGVHARNPSGANGIPQAAPPPNNMRQKDGSNIFNIPIDEDMFKSPRGHEFKSRSTESINTKFSPSEWSGKFEGTPDYFAAPPIGKTSRGRTSPVRSGSRTRPVPPPPPPPPPPMPPPPPGPPPAFQPNPIPKPPPAVFSPEEWQQTFKEASWVYPQKPPSPTRSPSAAVRQAKPPKPRKVPTTVPKAATVSDVSDETEIPTGPSASSADSGPTAADDSAMDIDEEIPAAASGQPELTTPTKGPRMVPVSPARPEWKEAGPKRRGAGPKLNLSDLKNVAPFSSTTQEGLRSLDDLSSTLPFESRPSAQHPLKASVGQAPQLPPPPKAVSAPQVLTKAAWNEYLQRMSIYMSEWNKWNATMLRIFEGRQQAVGGLGPPISWLGATGETSRGGVDSYVQGLVEDERARIHWGMGCSMHKTAMDEFTKVRERVLKGGLPDV